MSKAALFKTQISSSIALQQSASSTIMFRFSALLRTVWALDVEEICVLNKAAFDIRLTLKSLNQSSANPIDSPSMYPQPRKACVSPQNLDAYVRDGETIYCNVAPVGAVGGKTQDCNEPRHTYKFGSRQRANFKCTGPITNYDCFFVGTESIDSQCSENDVDIFAANLDTNYRADMKSCGLKCLAGAHCVAKCMTEKEGYTSACASCMGDVQACTVFFCPVCSASPDGEKCDECVYRNCQLAFTDCTGIGAAG